MTRKRSRSAPPTSSTEPEGSPKSSASAGRRWSGFFLGQLLGATLGRFVNVIAAVVLGAAAVFLTIAWQMGPQRVIDAKKYSKLTARADGRIIETWLALELDPKAMGTHLLWRAFADASQCAVVEYEGDWGAPIRRAFCGPRFKFSESYTLHNLTEMAPRVPFTWARDPNGFAVPEIRMTPAARQWLATHPPHSTFALPKPPPQTALEELRIDVDRPVDLAILGWGFPPPKFPLALDPKNPREGLPVGFLESRAGFNWPTIVFVTLFGGVVGLLLWYEGMAILFGDLPRVIGLLLFALPLVFLPWWGEQFPRYLSRLHAGFAGVITDMLHDIDPLGRLVATDPADATLAGGERLTWQAGDSAYADTFGRFRFTLPNPAPTSPDAAVAALAWTVADQARSLREGERIQIFARLKEDKERDHRGAGLIFLPAAKEAFLGPESSPALRRAADRFLWAWFTQPIAVPYERDPGYNGRLLLYRDFADFPTFGIADSARRISGAPEPKQ